MLWAATALTIATRRGWLDRPRPVRWRTVPMGDQSIMLAGLLVSGLAVSVVASLAGAKPGESPTSVVSLLGMITASAVTLCTWLALRRAPDASIGTAPLTMPGAAVAGLTGLVVAWPCVALVANLGDLAQVALGGSPAPDVAHITLESLRAHAREPSAWGVALAVVTLTPLTEEVVWRGAVQQSLKRVGLPRLVAVGVTAALFALVHWSAVPEASRLSALPALAMLGFALGWLMERTGRLIAPVVAHGAFNAANLLLFSMLG